MKPNINKNKPAVNNNCGCDDIEITVVNEYIPERVVITPEDIEPLIEGKVDRDDPIFATNPYQTYLNNRT